MTNHGPAAAPDPCLAFLGSWRVRASDPELSTAEFSNVATNGVTISSLEKSIFASARLRNAGVDKGNVATGTSGLGSVGEFGALEVLVVSCALLLFPPGSVDVWPHTHPRITEGLFGLEGGLDVELVDTTSKQFSQRLGEGGQFAFPKGLLRFRINLGKLRKDAKALAGLSTWSPGLDLVRLQPKSVFKSSIPSNVLAKAFDVCASVAKGLKAATTSSSWVGLVLSVGPNSRDVHIR